MNKWVTTEEMRRERKRPEVTDPCRNIMCSRCYTFSGLGSCKPPETEHQWRVFGPPALSKTEWCERCHALRCRRGT